MFERLVFKLVFKNKRPHKNLIPVDTNYDQSDLKKLKYFGEDTPA